MNIALCYTSTYFIFDAKPSEWLNFPISNDTNQDVCNWINSHYLIKVSLNCPSETDIIICPERNFIIKDAKSIVYTTSLSFKESLERILFRKDILNKTIRFIYDGGSNPGSVKIVKVSEVDGYRFGGMTHSDNDRRFKRYLINNVKDGWNGIEVL